MSKTKGEWKTRTIAEWKATAAVAWRAQLSTAPDGKEFAGIRKYVIKADGSEIADRAGFSMLYDGGTIGETVDNLCDLLQKLKGGVVKIKSEKSKPKSKGQPETQVVGDFVLTKGERFLTRVMDGAIKSVTEMSDKVKRFVTIKDAKAFIAEHGTTGWKISTVNDEEDE